MTDFYGARMEAPRGQRVDRIAVAPQRPRSRTKNVLRWRRGSFKRAPLQVTLSMTPTWIGRLLEEAEEGEAAAAKLEGEKETLQKMLAGLQEKLDGHERKVTAMRAIARDKRRQSHLLKEELVSPGWVLEAAAPRLKPELNLSTGALTDNLTEVYDQQVPPGGARKAPRTEGPKALVGVRPTYGVSGITSRPSGKSMARCHHPCTRGFRASSRLSPLP